MNPASFRDLGRSGWLMSLDGVARARQNNQNSDNYVFTIVAFALVLFFSGVSSNWNLRRTV